MAKRKSKRPARLDPARLSANALAELLTAGGTVQVHAAEVANRELPRNEDGTYHLLRVIAHLAEP